MTKEDFIEKSKLILTNTFVKGGSTEDVFDKIYDNLVLPKANVIKSVCGNCEHFYINKKAKFAHDNHRCGITECYISNIAINTCEFFNKRK